ncbi:hypothetical protein R1flu_017481 [Riccia fluitans]|uniref:XS domain-containing protein n=1 Tax=Riccia fluitans TaxID=41844 RepID=A0ABD1ZDD6_9MARC
MYRPAPRFDGRAQEKSSRSTRSAWIDNRSFASPLEADDGPRSSAPYISEDSLVERDFQGHRGNDDLGPRGNNDLREAQRLAASFFSSQIPPSGSTSLYRDPRTARTLSPEVPIDRFGSQTSRQYRERDANDEQKWVSNRSGSQERHLSNRSATEPEYWEDVESYGMAGSRSRKAEDNYGWEEVDGQYAARKESEYSVHGETEAARVTRRVDWTGLFRDGRDVYASDSSVGRRSTSVSLYGARQLGEAFPGGQEDLVDPEEAMFSSRSRESVEDFRHGRGYHEAPDGIEPEYGPGASVGAARNVSRGGPRDVDWDRNVGRHEDKDFWHGGMRNNGFSESNEFPRRFPEGPVSIQSGFSNTPVARREFINPKPDYSVRASLTNRDILGIYYGNSNHHFRKDLPRHGGVPFDRHERLPFGGVPGPWHGPPRPAGGFNRERNDWGPMRKGKKRWPRSPRAGENPHLSHTSQGKRFKRETEADKLFLMHNSKATLASLSESREKKEQPHPSAKGKEKETTPTRDDPGKKVEKEGKPVETGLWDETWSDSEEDKVGDRNAPHKDKSGPAADTCVRELEEEVAHARSVAPVETVETAGDNSSPGDIEPGGKSLTVNADDQEDGSSQKDVSNDVATPDISGNADIGMNVRSTQVQEPNDEKDDEKSMENEDSDMFDADGNVEKSRIDSSGDGSLSGGGGNISEKSLLFGAQEADKNQENKAYEFYVSVLERDDNLRKLYEGSSNSGSFECLVCAGVGAKKKKRFPDVTSMIQHAKKIIKTKKLQEHRGFARAVCHILGWDSTVSSPSPRTSNLALAPQEQAQPATHFSDGSKFQVSSTVAADSNWSLESARRFLEEQLKDPDSDPSVPENLVQKKMGICSSGSVSEEIEADIEMGDGSKRRALLVEPYGLGDKGLSTGGRSFASGVNNRFVSKSPRNSVTWIPDGRGENAVSKPTPSTTDDLDGPGIGTLLGERAGSSGTVKSGDVTQVKTEFLVLQDTSKQSHEHPAAEVPSVERYAGCVEGEIQTLSSVASAPVTKDAEISFQTQTVGESTANHATGGTSAFVRFGTPATLPVTVKVEPPEMSFSVLLAMQEAATFYGGQNCSLLPQVFFSTTVVVQLHFGRCF